MNNISVDEYSRDIENCLTLMNQIMYDSISDNMDNVENSILDYLHNKFTNMSVSKDEIHAIINKAYQTRNFKLKKEVECNLGKAKFDFEDKSNNHEKIISLEIDKLRKMCSSVKTGTNYCYLGLVDNCTQEIIGWLIRWHNNIAFSKETENVRKDIRSLISQNYILIMNTMGDKLIFKIVNPLETKYLPGKSLVNTK